ncbi:MAG: DNA ligase [Methylibium sp. NZG]|nr:MAG: DNA ligase [Methylibium sp. NZG]
MTRLSSSVRRLAALALWCAATLWSGMASAQPALLLANVYAGHIDPTSYLVSEKFDGVRAVWDGTTLRFRSGRTVPAPAWFTQKLPAQALDGELWLARGQFDALSAIVRREVPVDDEWKRVSYLVFELPGAPGSFAERAQAMRELTARVGWPQLRAVEQSPVTDRQALKRRLDQTVAQGGEGLMLHLASAPYSTGRSDVLLKLKPYLDTEAVVVAHRAGKGKHAGRLGALQVQTPAGRRFYIGTGFSDEQREQPPPVGSTVTYRYRDLTSTGLPRFASFLRVYSPP